MITDNACGHLGNSILYHLHAAVFNRQEQSRYRCVRGAWIVSVLMMLLAVAPPGRASWPTYRHDNARGGATVENAPRKPTVAWVYQSPSRPRPAWDEPALWDGWSKVHNLTNRQEFDKAFHVAVENDRVYFGSSVDDKVYCLDAHTGRVLWQFYTEGPVRLAPSIANQRVYVGSDDGFVYCLEAKTGKLVWKHQPGRGTRRIPGNGRIISPWAIRTGVAVADGRVYCGAGVIPSETVFVCALDAETGEVIWKTSMNDLPAQGYLLASIHRLYVMTSRDRPLVFDATTGKRLEKVKVGVGGTFALLTGDTLLYGPGKTGQLNMVGSKKEDVLASFSGNHMIVSRPFSFLQKGNQLSALDRQSYVNFFARRKAVTAETQKLSDQLKEANAPNEKRRIEAAIAPLQRELKSLTQSINGCVQWTVTCEGALSLILAGRTLVAGGDGIVVGMDASTGVENWNRRIRGKAHGLAVSGGRLFVSTDEGAIYCFAERPNGEFPTDTARNRTRMQPYMPPFAATRAPPAEILGPFAEYQSPGTVRISWETRQPATSYLEFGVNEKNTRTWRSKEQKLYHEFIVENVQRDIVHRYRVGGVLENGRSMKTETYRFDSHFEYLPATLPNHPSPYPNDDLTAHFESTARRMVELSGTKRGYALVLGSENGRLAYHLARNSDFRIVIVEPNINAVQQTRKKLDSVGMQGRISVHHRRLDSLVYGPFTANLIVSGRTLTSGELPGNLPGIYRCLRPAGGTICLGTWNRDKSDNTSARQFAAWLGTTTFESQWKTMSIGRGKFWVHNRPKLAGTGQWTHQYASANNSSCSDDQRIRGDMMVQWWGRPGARPMPDRGNRNPAPVSANGRLFVQGNRILFGMDAYNGTILWSIQIPTMRRANLPRDCSNMVATDTHLYVAINDTCVAFDAQTGQRERQFRVPDRRSNRSYQWGYLSTDGKSLLGTGVRRDSHYMGDEGEWYQRYDPRDMARVTSDFLFAMDEYDGEKKWSYGRGVIVNSTITVSDGTIYFIESRNEHARKAPTGRLLDEIMEKQFLVALDHDTGHVVWEKPYDFSKCRRVTYLTVRNGTILVTGTDRDREFHTFAFDTETNRELWRHTAPDKKGHHTGELAHPTIVGSRVYFNKHTYDLRTGQVLVVDDFNWHGCGVMSASRHSIFSRYEYHGMYDLVSGKRTEFLGIRGGCWLNLIPSGGLLLAPEASAGCSCGHSLQTSIAYVPVSLWLDSELEKK